MNVGQYLFWTWQVHKLIDKLMSRNFAEYIQVTKPADTSIKVQLPEDNEDQLDTLNRMLS